MIMAFHNVISTQVKCYLNLEQRKLQKRLLICETLSGSICSRSILSAPGSQGLCPVYVL